MRPRRHARYGKCVVDGAVGTCADTVCVVRLGITSKGVAIAIGVLVHIKKMCSSSIGNLIGNGNTDGCHIFIV
jgi:hypothetical protein